MKTKSSILVVDDNKKLCESLRDILEDDGYTVELANDGKDAIAMLQVNRYDIALVDIRLPDISGEELVRKLISISPSVEFVYMTAHATVDSAVEAVKQERVVSYELKPLNMRRLLSVLSQVVKRRKAEEEIRKLTHAVEQSSCTVMITEAKGNIEYVNPAFADITGYSTEEVLGKPPSILKSSKTSPEVYRELWKTIRNGNEWSGEFCNRKKNGELYWEKASISPVKDDNGVITNFIAIKEDISERKKAEKLLNTEHIVTELLAGSFTIKEAYSKILQAICMTLEWDFGEVWILDKNDYLFRCADTWHIPSIELPEFEKITRQIAFPPGVGLPGRILSSAKPAWITDVVRDSNFPRAEIASKEGLHGAFGFPIISGREVLGSINFYSHEIRQVDKDLIDIMSSIGSQIGLFIKRKRADIELEKSETKYRKLIETAQDAIICIDEDGIVNIWNQSAEKIFGYSKDEIIGKSIEIIIPDEYKKQHQEGIKLFIDTGKSRIIGKTIEVSGITKEKASVPLEMSLASQKIENEKYFFTAIIRDLTERKKIEETLLQSEKLKSMGMMTSGVAHDFNNLLAIISGNVQLLEKRYENNRELTEVLHTIKRATKDGADIVGRMAKFTKVERDISEFIPVDIEEMIQQAVDFSRHRWMNMARAAGITYDIDLKGIKKTPVIMGNTAELREVFINIINNALDIMDTGGRISFRTWAENDAVFVSITDTGAGMAEEVRKRIFDPFFTTKRAKGSGLGMSVAYGIVTGHGGKIDVESKKGKGTTFTVSFPVAGEIARQTVLSEPSQKIAHKLRILVVDDEKAICNLLETFFSRDGHDVKSVSSGSEAIKLLKNEKYDVVLTDLIMPDLSGLDVINTVDGLEKRPCLGLITGWSDNVDNKEKEELKVDFVLKKPFDFTELTNRINNVIITAGHNS